MIPLLLDVVTILGEEFPGVITVDCPKDFKNDKVIKNSMDKFFIKVCRIFVYEKKLNFKLENQIYIDNF
ncbi:hypothetical protein GCM10011514_29050 [Emticicia aquatilis]|uniref:Uncharacterized protein n=1 Tax=Emticicia aquatilis TaxID=1537369 RepID=A0A916YW26_9BACT|nr:hypothetical protein GCM10011514_29050 [Emticicia aquatilis]